MKVSFVLLILLLALISTPCWSADFRKGTEAYENGDYATAISEWGILARQGDRDAQFNLGLMYETGQGVPQDEETAVKWYTLAAEQGHVDAQAELGTRYENGIGVSRDLNRAYDWLFKAAEQGDNFSKYNAANLIGESEVREKDGKLKLQFLEEARISGQIIRGFSENSLGYLYLKGAKGVKKDFKKSLFWSIEGGKKGAPNAYANVALQYFAGLGVRQNYEMMVGYLLKSLEKFEDVDDWVLQEDDDWIPYKNKAPKDFWIPRQLYWKYVMHKDEKYIHQLRELIK